MSRKSYPVLTDRQKRTICDMLKCMVSKPESVGFHRHFSGLDLDIGIEVAPEDRHVFSAEVCLALATVIGAVTGVCKPVVYLEGDPHPAAQDALAYVAAQV